MRVCTVSRKYWMDTLLFHIIFFHSPSVYPSVSWVSLCHIVRTDVYNSFSKLPIEWVGDEVSQIAKLEKDLGDIFLSVGGFQGVKLGSLLINMNFCSYVFSN